MLNDGRLVGLVLVDETVQQISRFPAAFGYTNVTDAACRTDIARQDCTPNTLVTDANTTQWLWAGDTLLSPVAQQRIGLRFTAAKSLEGFERRARAAGRGEERHDGRP